MNLKGVIYKIQLRSLSCILGLLFISCGMNKEKELKNEYPASDDERLYGICSFFLSNDVILSDWEIWDLVVVSFCYGNDTINIVSFSDEIYKKVNMRILDETTFTNSLYAHISENIPIEVDSALFAKYSLHKIVPCPEVTELYKTKGIGAVLLYYMKGERYLPDWSPHPEEEDFAQIYRELNLINYIIYLAFQHRIFFGFTTESTYWIDDKGFDIMEKARLEELAEKKEKEGVKLRKDSVE